MRSFADTEMRREKVGVFWLRGFSEREIAKAIREDASLRNCDKTTHVTIHKDITAIRGKLVEASTERLMAAQAEGVARLRMIQRTAWLDFASCNVQDPNTNSLRARYLSIIADCEEKIAKMEGTISPMRISQTDPEGKALIPTFIMEMPDGSIVRSQAGDNGHKEVKADEISKPGS